MVCDWYPNVCADPSWLILVLTRWHTQPRTPPTAFSVPNRNKKREEEGEEKLSMLTHATARGTGNKWVGFFIGPPPPPPKKKS